MRKRLCCCPLMMRLAMLLATSTENQLAEFEWTELCLPRDTLTGESAAMLCSGHRQKPTV